MEEIESAVCEITFDNLDIRFYDLRVDHLNEDELDFELEIREILVKEDKSMSRKRRLLRESLKAEKEINTDIFKSLKRAPHADVRECEEKLASIESAMTLNAKQIPARCQSSLLHLGNRLKLLRNYVGEEEMTRIDKLIGKVLYLLNCFFYQKRAKTVGQTDLQVDRLGPRGEPSESYNAQQLDQHQEGGNFQHNQVMGDEVGIVESLKRLGLLSSEVPDPKGVRLALVALERELVELRTFKESQTERETWELGESEVNQRDRHEAQLPTTTIAGLERCNTPSVTSSAKASVTRVTFSTFPSIFPGVSGVESEKVLPRQVNTYPLGSQTTNNPPIYTSVSFTHGNELSYSSGYPLRYSAPSVETYKHSSYSHLNSRPQSMGQPDTTSFPEVSNSEPRHLQSLELPVCRSYSEPLSYQGAQINRPSLNYHTLPISKWKIEKYAGTDQGLKLNEFIHWVTQLALSERVSEDELFDSAFHLFTGPALSWYMSQRAAGRLLNWYHLLTELRRTFAHPELDALLRTRIYQRRQQRGETFQEYYFEMEGMFRAMISPMNDAERLDVLRRNMRLDYKKALMWKPILSLHELQEAGHVIDASNFSLYSKVFGGEKTVNALNCTSASIKNNSSEHDRRLVLNKPKPNTRTQFQPKVENFKQSSYRAKPSTNYDPKEGPSKPTRTLEMLVNAHRPPRSYECLYCREPNHTLEQCKNYRGLLCMICGFKGFDSQNCPYCQKNLLQVVESRRPPVTSA